MSLTAVTRFKCVVCGKLTAGSQPYGEGTDIFPRKHKVNGIPCPGNNEEAEYVDVPIAYWKMGKPVLKKVKTENGRTRAQV